MGNDVDDDKKIEAGVDCFMGEFEAGRPVVWDVLTVTVEGDPIPMRYDFDGAEVVITRASSRDSFGSGGVEEQRCESVRRADRFPEGSGCERSSGDGFRSDSLP